MPAGCARQRERPPGLQADPVRRVLVPNLPPSNIPASDLDRAVPRLLHHALFVGSAAGRRRQEPRPQRMARKGAGVQPGLAGRPLHDPRDRIGVQPARGHMAVPIDGAEERAAGDFGRFKPGLERRDRAALAGQPRDADQASLPLLVRLPAAQPQHDPLRFVGLDVSDVEPNELGAPKRADEPDEQERPIAQIDEATRAQRREQLAQRVGHQRGLVGLLPAQGPADALPGGDDERASDWVFFFRRPVGEADRGQPAGDGGQLVPPLDELVEVQGDRLGRGRQGGEAVGRAPRAEVSDVVGVGAAGGGCPAGVDVAADPADRWA